ncbi:MAG: response regulator [Deltaproteobacteria bacterium]|nr:response regulator [Deltaproteobacteria bacterium]MBW2143549.1 response regulator [Deltaproteobacteria bacterium]
MHNNKKILVVDDEAHIRRVIEIKLKKRGYQVITAKNGQEGFDIVQTQQPDVVISDINMPVMDGKTLCEKTNELKKERPFLTIMVTARILPEDREWVDRMQDTLFLEKPFSPAEIMEHVEKYLGGQ